MGAVLFVAICAVLFAVTGQAAEPVNVIVNGWALGIDNATGCPGDINSGWQHNSEMSLSRCSKNPAPPDGTTQGGAAFKCGPVQGQCAPNVLGESWQDFSLEDRGVAVATAYTVTYQHLQVCVGCNFIRVDLLGSVDGQTWQDLGRLINHPGTAGCDTSTYWLTYCGELANVPYMPFYRLYVTGMYSQQLGYKFTGVELYFAPVVEPTATAVYLPLILDAGAYQLVCAGKLTINEQYVICEN